MTEPTVGVLMFVAYRSMEEQIYAAVRAAGYTDVTLTQGRFFARIGAAGTRLTDLAEMAQVTKQSAGFLVDQLERTGYVERVPDPADARARLVRVAPRGRLARAVATRTQYEVEEQWRRHLGPGAMDRLEQTMLRLREITDPYVEHA